MVHIMISLFPLVIVCTVWHRPCLSNPIYESEYAHTITSEKYAHGNNNVTESTYDKEDVVSVLAAEFLFLIAGDHVFLPPPSESGEDFELHKNAQILAKLLTKLNCTQRVYALFNATVQGIDEQLWNDEYSSDHHLFTTIFERIIEQLKKIPDVNTQFLYEKNNVKNESILHVEFPGESATNERSRTFYDIPSSEIPALEQLLDTELIKKVVFTIELLMQAEEELVEIPESAKMYRKRLETAKGLFKLAMSENMEIRLRIQKIFDDVLNQAVRNYEMVDVFGYTHRDELCDSLLTKMENDDMVRDEFYCLKTALQ